MDINETKPVILKGLKLHVGKIPAGATGRLGLQGMHWGTLVRGQGIDAPHRKTQGGEHRNKELPGNKEIHVCGSEEGCQCQEREVFRKG